MLKSDGLQIETPVLKISLRYLTYEFIQGLTNTRPGRPGQVEKYAGQVFYFQKKPTGP